MRILKDNTDTKEVLMKKLRVFYLIVVLTLLAVSVVISSGITQAGAVPDGFMGVPWGAGRDQIIKAMSERGYQQLTSDNPNQLNFKGAFAGVPCLHLYFDLSANSFYRGAAYGCARSADHQSTQETLNRIVNMISEKYGPPQGRHSGRYAYNPGFRNCKGCPEEYASWDFVDSRSDKYSISLELSPSTFFYTNEAEACRVDITIIYEAESLGKRLEKKDY
jgi:hypothetical protein